MVEGTVHPKSLHFLTIVSLETGKDDVWQEVHTAKVNLECSEKVKNKQSSVRNRKSLH